MVVLEKRLRSGREVPELQDEPYLPQGLVGLWNAYVTLDRSRPFHESAMLPIPISEMKAYMEVFGITSEEDRETFIRVMQMVDSHAVKKANDEAKKKSGSSKGDKPSAGKGKTIGK